MKQESRDSAFILPSFSPIMSFRILRNDHDHLDRVSLQVVRQQPAEVELHVDFYLDQPLTGLELRGRLMGPRCAYASTVEVAYHLRPLGQPAPDASRVQGRIIIPEASLWEPLCPHLYQGPLELWQASRSVVQVQASIGLRHATLKKGLHWNGHPLLLRGRTMPGLDEVTARNLRSAGVNLVLVPPGRDTAQVLEQANRHGLLVLFHFTSPSQTSENMGLPPPHEPSWLGCLVRAELLEEEMLQSFGPRSQPGRLLGIELLSPESRPGAGNFICCPADLLPAATETGLPILLRGRPEAVPERVTLLGYIEE